MVHSILFRPCFKPKQTPYKNDDGSETIYTMEGESLWFVNGLCKLYDETYEEEVLSDYISEETFNEIMFKINDCGVTYFPCDIALSIGWCFCLFTLGLSFLIPMVCACDMLESIKRAIKEVNDRILVPRGLRLVFVKKCLRYSWVRFIV